MVIENTGLCSELYLFLNLLGEEYIKCIPDDLYEYICNNTNLEDINNIKKDDYINEISDEALNMISYFNLKYWAKKDEKKELYKIYKNNDIPVKTLSENIQEVALPKIQKESKIKTIIKSIINFLK